MANANSYNYQKISEIENLNDPIKKLLLENNLALPWIKFNELEFDKKIGEGGFAVVYLANWKSLDVDGSIKNKTVALKLIHGSKNGGNIFQDNLYNAYIGDLEFATAVNKTLDTKSRIYGVLQYIAPEVLRGKSFTKASDIYSFGIIMWEISSGRAIYSEFSKYNEYADDQSLAIEICKGLRPNIFEGTVPCYAALLKECWNENPEKRPSASKILKTITEWKNGNLSEFIDSNNKMIKNVKIDDNSICSSKFINCINKLNIVDKYSSICNSKFIKKINQLNITDKHSSVCSIILLGILIN
ncbi:kinase-like domain-containing protein [Gigaspora margarita]|uniref:Kinase-like domain-containing protein n=1 Tax=Gigaspora margarita TaxID=4874 RepID=A0A8H3X655_GIGMA|nr:kinase-like domain-containing protein [Gigaspora margarita]